MAHKALMAQLEDALHRRLVLCQRIGCRSAKALMVSLSPSGILVSMTDVTHILAQIASGDPIAAVQLLPPVHDELHQLAREKPGQKL